MSRLFISHSSHDEAAVQQFIEFLILGMGIPGNDIFCTSQKGTLIPGEPFMEKIKEKLVDCEKVICYITPDYLHSVTCLTEMGAAWYQTGKIIPLIVNPLHFTDLNNTPLMGLQMLQNHNREDMIVLYREFRTLGIALDNQVKFDQYLTRYIEALQQTSVISKDSSGYYQAKIAEIRRTPPAYRCYKLDGLLQLNGAVPANETHWIFYRAGMYEDLAVNDVIRFSIDSTESRKFPDIGMARNIYPKDMYKLKIK